MDTIVTLFIQKHDRGPSALPLYNLTYADERTAAGPMAPRTFIGGDELREVLLNIFHIKPNFVEELIQNGGSVPRITVTFEQLAAAGLRG